MYIYRYCWGEGLWTPDQDPGTPTRSYNVAKAVNADAAVFGKRPLKANPKP